MKLVNFVNLYKDTYRFYQSNECTDLDIITNTAYHSDNNEVCFSKLKNKFNILLLHGKKYFEKLYSTFEQIWDIWTS